MTVSPRVISEHIPRSDWTTEPSLITDRTQASVCFSNNNVDDNGDQLRIIDSSSKIRKISPYLTLIIGLLIGGILAAVFLALWLSSLNQTITSTTTTTTSSTTSSTTTTTTTTTSTTTVTTTVTTTTTTIITPTINILWAFDGNTNDKYNNYNAASSGGPTYVTGIIGQSSTALSIDGTLSQCVIMSSFISLAYQSFTVELWFYPTMLGSGDFGLFVQCQTTSQDLCLIYMIRGYRLYLAFYADDTPGITTISINQCYHAAFVYDYPTSTQSVYLNGILELSRVSNAYQGTSGSIYVGAINNGLMSYFNGYIDQISLVTRTKSAEEILMDATLVFYYNFDGSIYTDLGPLSLTALGTSVSQAIGAGRINSAISFNLSPSYFVVGGLTRLGTIGYAYSISLWIKPSSITQAIIVYVSKCSSSCSSNWCLPFIGITSSGEIAIQSWSGAPSPLVELTGPVLSVNVWTHVVQTYSSNNGMRLFINGVLYNQSQVFIYYASSAPNNIFLGNFPLSVCVPSDPLFPNQYYGLIDEFYLFARDLTPTEVSQLANP